MFHEASVGDRPQQPTSSAYVCFKLYLEGDISPSSSFAIYFRYISVMSMTLLHRVSLQFWSKKEKNEKKEAVKDKFLPSVQKYCKAEL